MLCLHDLSALFEQPPEPFPGFDAEIGLDEITDMRHGFFHTIRDQQQFVVVLMYGPFFRHFIDHPEQGFVIGCAYEYDGEIRDGFRLYQGKDLKEFIHGPETARHDNERVGVFYQ